jgi:hypothetical protein
MVRSTGNRAVDLKMASDAFDPVALAPEHWILSLSAARPSDRTRGFLYLVAVMDWVSGYVLAWRLSKSARHELLHRSSGEALSKGEGERIHGRSCNPRAPLIQGEAAASLVSAVRGDLGGLMCCLPFCVCAKGAPEGAVRNISGPCGRFLLFDGVLRQP